MNVISPMIPHNILRGKLGVASGWDTDPSNLANCTDGDIAIVTGTGSTVKAAAGDYGVVGFDFGIVKTMLVGGKVGMWSSAGGVKLMVNASDDNVNWKSNWCLVVDYTSASEALFDMMPSVVVGRYVRLQFNVSAAATAYAKIYEVMAWELAL